MLATALAGISKFTGRNPLVREATGYLLIYVRATAWKGKWVEGQGSVLVGMAHVGGRGGKCA